MMARVRQGFFMSIACPIFAPGATTTRYAAIRRTKAKEVGMDCVVTSAVAETFHDSGHRLIKLGPDHVRGIEREIELYGLKRLPVHERR